MQPGTTGEWAKGQAGSGVRMYASLRLLLPAANNFNERLLGRLEKILYRCALDHREEAEERGGEEKPVQVYVTG